MERVSAFSRVVLLKSGLRCRVCPTSKEDSARSRPTIAPQATAPTNTLFDVTTLFSRFPHADRRSSRIVVCVYRLYSPNPEFRALLTLAA
jgi:hypothetical protein